MRKNPYWYNFIPEKYRNYWFRNKRREKNPRQSAGFEKVVHIYFYMYYLI